MKKRKEKIIISIMAVVFSVISMVIGIVLSCSFLGSPEFPVWIRGLCVFCFIAAGVFVARLTRLMFGKE